VKLRTLNDLGKMRAEHFSVKSLLSVPNEMRGQCVDGWMRSRALQS